MKNYTITEEQIKKISTKDQIVEEYLNEWFTEASEKELEIGKWYISNDVTKHIFYVTEITEDKYYYYGFNSGGQWCKNEYYSFNDAGLKNGFRLATEEEIQKSLINECKNRYKIPQSLQYIDGKVDDELLGWALTFRNNSLGASGAEQDVVFKDGIWAEVKEEPIILNYHQIAKKFGINVNRIRISRI